MKRALNSKRQIAKRISGLSLPPVYKIELGHQLLAFAGKEMYSYDLAHKLGEVVATFILAQADDLFLDNRDEVAYVTAEVEGLLRTLTRDDDFHSDVWGYYLQIFEPVIREIAGAVYRGENPRQTRDGVDALRVLNISI